MTTSRVELLIEDDRSLLLDGDREPTILLMSPRTLAARHWRQDRPDALQLERAIDDVENAIEQAGLRHAERGVLHAATSLCRLLPPPFSMPGDFSRDAVEAEFSRLVVASGTTRLDAGLVPSGDAAAALLLVREVMHHLGFHSLRTER